MAVDPSLCGAIWLSWHTARVYVLFFRYSHLINDLIKIFFKINHANGFVFGPALAIRREMSTWPEPVRPQKEEEIIMSAASAASQLATAMRTSVAQHARGARQAVKPQNAGRVALSSPRGNKADATMQLDATGQAVPSAKGVRKGSATASFASLLG